MPNPSTAADSPRSAVRRALAAGGWFSLAAVAGRCGDTVPDATALNYYRRSVKYGRAEEKTKAGQLRVGRGRAVREALNHLCHAGECEAAGPPDARAYRLVPKETAAVLPPRPKPKEEYVPIDRLTFVSRLQMREHFETAAGELLLYDEAHVLEMLAAVSERGETLPPPELVRETDKRGRVTNWVFAGFHRGEVHRRLMEKGGPASIKCLVYEGTFADARLWALPENAANPLHRSDHDRRRAVNTLLDDLQLYARVVESGLGNGGVTKAIQQACRVSAGLVYLVLQSRNQHITRTGRLEALPGDPSPPRPAGKRKPPPATEPEPHPRAGERPGPPAATAPGTPAGEAPGIPADMPSPGEVTRPSDVPADLIEQAARAVRRLDAALDAVAGHPLLYPHLRRLAAAHGLAVEWVQEFQDQFAKGTAVRWRAESAWLAGCRATLADLAAAVAAGGE